jgi:hypothetical protein
MSVTLFRNAAAGLLISLFAAGLLAQCGCSNDSQGSAAEGLQPAPAVAPVGAPKKEDGKELKQPLIRTIDKALDDVPDQDAADLGTSKDEARNILKEADETLTRIKEQNREGLRRANNPPRRIVPVPPAESKEAEPQTEQKSPEGPAEAAASPAEAASPEAKAPAAE